MARGGAGRLPPIRSTTTRFRKWLISSPLRHQCEERRFPLDPAPERFLELPLLDPRREDEDLLREVCFDAFCFLTTSPSWILPRQAPVSTSCISMKALKRARSARTARFT